MTVVKIEDYTKSRPDDELGPMSITFFGSQFNLKNGKPSQLNFTVTVENGDVLGILESVKETGGVGGFAEGQYQFLPYPCAAVVIHPVDEPPLENLRQTEHFSRRE